FVLPLTHRHSFLSRSRPTPEEPVAGAEDATIKDPRSRSASGGGPRTKASRAPRPGRKRPAGADRRRVGREPEESHVRNLYDSPRFGRIARRLDLQEADP